LYKYMNCHLIT